MSKPRSRSSSKERKTNENVKPAPKPAPKTVTTAPAPQSALGNLAISGGAGSGKSTVASMLELWGAHTISCDQAAHQMYAKEHPQSVHAQLVANFGTAVLDTHGGIDRGVLGDCVLGKPNQLAKLNNVMLPLLTECVKAMQKGGRLLVLDGEGVALQELGVHTVWVVTASAAKRVERIAERMGCDTEKAALYLADEPSDAERVEGFTSLGFSVHVIDNNGVKEELCPQVQKLAALLPPFAPAPVSENKLGDFSGYYSVIPRDFEEFERHRMTDAEYFAQKDNTAALNSSRKQFDAVASLAALTVLSGDADRSLCGLPREVWCNVLTCLDPCRVANAARACKSLLGAACDDWLWTYMVGQHFGAMNMTQVHATSVMCLYRDVLGAFLANNYFWSKLMFTHSRLSEHSKFQMMLSRERDHVQQTYIKGVMKSAGPPLPRPAALAPGSLLVPATTEAHLKELRALVSRNFNPGVMAILALLMTRKPTASIRMSCSALYSDVGMSGDKVAVAAVYRVLPNFTSVRGLLEILFVAVVDWGRDAGVASGAAEHIEACARAAGCRAMYVETGPVESVKFWESRGFVTIEQEVRADNFDRSYFDIRCLRFKDTQQHVKYLKY